MGDPTNCLRRAREGKGEEVIPRAGEERRLDLIRSSPHEELGCEDVVYAIALTTERGRGFEKKRVRNA
jgi:hypothetical protein